MEKKTYLLPIKTPYQEARTARNMMYGTVNNINLLYYQENSLSPWVNRTICFQLDQVQKKTDMIKQEGVAAAVHSAEFGSNRAWSRRE
jgi:hypothetical protein